MVMAVATKSPRRRKAARRAARALPFQALCCVLLLGGCAAAPHSAGGPVARASSVTSATAMDIATHMRASGNLSGAISFYRRAIALDPDLINAYLGLGDTLLAAGYPNDAAHAFRAALAKKPGNSGAESGLGATLVTLDQPTAAIAVLRKSVATKPSARAYAALGVAENLLGDGSAADKAYRAGLAIASGDLGLLNDLGLSQALQGNYDAAVATLRRVASSPQATARHRLNLALVLGLAGRTQEAARVASIDLDPRSVRDNLAYYAELRAMSPRARAEAILNPSTEAQRRLATICDTPGCGSPDGSPDGSHPKAKTKTKLSAPRSILKP